MPPTSGGIFHIHLIKRLEVIILCQLQRVNDRFKVKARASASPLG